MKKLILLTIIATIFFSPTIALAKGGHGGRHGGHGSHHGGSHSHSSKTGGSKSSAKSGSKSSSKTFKSSNSGSKSTSHTSKYSVLHGGGKSAFARNAFRASSNATPVSSWKSLNTETKSFTDTTSNVPPFYRGGSVTNQLLFYSLYHPRNHYVPNEEKQEDLEKEEEQKSANNIMLIIGAIIVVVVIFVFICFMFL